MAGSGLVTGTRGVFLTLTAPGSVAHARPDGQLCGCTPVGGTDLASWNATAAARWNNFVRDLSRQMGADYFVEVTGADGKTRRHRRQGVSYFRAAEVQRRGALHFHVLLRRVDGKPVRLLRKKVRRLAIRHGFGHSVDVQRLEPGHAAYVAKYVAKSADCRADVPWSLWRAPDLSRRWYLLDQETGNIVARHTGEVVGRGQLVASPSFRTWSCSRSWGASMADVKAAQQHFVLTLEDLPAWDEQPVDPAWSSLFGVPRDRESSPPAELPI